MAKGRWCFGSDDLWIDRGLKLISGLGTTQNQRSTARPPCLGWTYTYRINKKIRKLPGAAGSFWKPLGSFWKPLGSFLKPLEAFGSFCEPLGSFRKPLGSFWKSLGSIQSEILAIRDGQTSPHRPWLVVSRSTCPSLVPCPRLGS